MGLEDVCLSLSRTAWEKNKKMTFCLSLRDLANFQGGDFCSTSREYSFFFGPSRICKNFHTTKKMVPRLTFQTNLFQFSHQDFNWSFCLLRLWEESRILNSIRYTISSGKNKSIVIPNFHGFFWSLVLGCFT